MRHMPRSLLLAALTLSVLAVSMVTAGWAYPGDVFTAGAPMKGPSIHHATEVPTGTYAVAPSTGAAQYTFPVVVPPGRAGLAPTVALS